MNTVPNTGLLSDIRLASFFTGWDEPWHYRYVGVEAAKYVMEKGICYEEFYKHYMPDFKY